MTVNKHNTQEVVSELDNVILSQKKGLSNLLNKCKILGLIPSITKQVELNKLITNTRVL